MQSRSAIGYCGQTSVILYGNYYALHYFTQRRMPGIITKGILHVNLAIKLAVSKSDTLNVNQDVC